MDKGPPAGGSRRLGWALLAYGVTLALAVTLAPFHFDYPGYAIVRVTSSPRDVLQNVALFLPLGFLYRFARRGPADRWNLRVLGLGVLLSLAIETAQVWEVQRYTSLVDVLSNGTGAWLGALLHRGIARRLGSGEALVGRFFFNLPLVGLLYLLVPILWLNELGIGPDPPRLLLTLLLASFGASVLAGLHRFRLAPAGRGSPARIALVAAAGCLLGVVPLLPRWPLVAGVLCGVVAGWVRVRAGRDRGERTGDRRFELRVLRASAPLFGLYLLGFALAPLSGGVGDWSATLWFPPAAVVSTHLLARLLEGIAAFTVLGYLLAEASGRRELDYSADLPRVLAFTAFAGVLVEVASGWAPRDAASGAQLLLLLTAGAYGGWLYHLQREQIRRLVAGGGSTEGR